ncbi:hypothetical protein ABMA28_010544 [Loxostege sticticalis]|uniref:Uncharacterized protein n=1 Tax=Loxostege sticticalis TaxID=481309 RepID=A0ABD0S8L1_LOXSC
MNALVQYQEEIHNRIVKAQIHFQKSPKERITQQYVEGKLELLEQMWFRFSSCHTELMQSFSTEVFKSDYFQNDVYDMTEEVYFEYRVALKTVLGQLISEITVPVASASSNCGSKGCEIKLPKVSIPTFSGKYSEWNTFRDLFNSLINKNQNLDNVQKLLYLKGYLYGEVEQCWKILEERYNNKKYICHHILKNLFSQQNIVNESACSLKELLDTTDNCLSALKNIGIDTNSWDVWIVHILTQKLDVESRRQWEFHASCNSVELPTYDQFRSFITKRYRAMEFLDPMFNSNDKRHVSVNKITSKHVTNIVSCNFCSKKHKLNCCGKFKRESVDSRRKFVLSNRICFCCLGSNHSAKFCQANVKCRICRKKHHALLHPAGKGTLGINSTVTQVKDTPHNDSGSTNVEGTDHNPVISCFSKKGHSSQVLLATVPVDTTLRRGTKFSRNLLDQGSQSSCRTESTVNH